MKRYIISFLVLLIAYTSGHAQSHTSFAGQDKFIISWEVAFPSNDFITHESYSGGRIAYAKMVKENLSVGLGGSWNSFSQYVPKTTYQKPDGSGALTSDIVKEVYSVPLTLDVNYYFKGGKSLVPYVGIGLGGQYSEQTIYFNIYSIGENGWGFVARPEIGVTYHFNSRSAINLGGIYNYSTVKSDAFNTDQLSHFVLSLGFVFSE